MYSYGWWGKIIYFCVVNDVSFEIWKGESLGFVGEFGCGKLMLIWVILGFEEVQSGEIIFDGQLVFIYYYVNIVVCCWMQVVFQDFYGSFNLCWKVGCLIIELFYLLDVLLKGSEWEEVIVEVLESVGFYVEDWYKYIYEFSGGQCQCIVIVWVLIIKLDLIILDEVVFVLDVLVCVQVLDLLVDLSDWFVLIYLFISYDFSVVCLIMDCVLVMKVGKIVEEGLMDWVFDIFENDYIR